MKFGGPEFAFPTEHGWGLLTEVWVTSQSSCTTGKNSHFLLAAYMKVTPPTWLQLTFHSLYSLASQKTVRLHAIRAELHTNDPEVQARVSGISGESSMTFPYPPSMRSHQLPISPIHGVFCKQSQLL